VAAWELGQRAVALVLLIVLSPALVAIALAVKLDSRGPALFLGERIGRGGRVFRIHKFRSMSGREAGPAITAIGDPRLTRVGRRIRAFRLDELPQLWDVVRGPMLLVGPRPEAPAFVDSTDPGWKEILEVRPGITGPTQLEFADEAMWLDGPDVENTYRAVILPRKMASDLAYVRSRSIRSDLAILWSTALFAMGRRRRGSA
jgi:lipopolysaccharide/colanic/teichoic acid biosynthesis glycosyltransferase